MTAKLTVKEFFNRFPTDDACLDHVMEVRFGMQHRCEACGQESTFHRLTERRAYSCARCGDHLYPCAGTIFQDSRTSLQLWFYAIYLFVVTRHGVSGKELERNLGVTYKTAWRMAKQIRKLMTKAGNVDLLKGHIEIDEAYVGGRRSGGKRGRGAEGKFIVVAMKEREGNMKAAIIENVRTTTLRPLVNENVEKGSTVSTDQLPSYRLLSADGYAHGAVNHHKLEYVRGIHHVNGVEGFWKLFKDSVRSTHIHISKKYANQYLGEFVFRSNYRGMQNAMFDLLIGAI